MKSVATSFSIPITLELRAATGSASARRGEPVTIGIPMPPGVVADGADLGVFRADGSSTTAQFDILDRWSDGSVRWVLADFQADASPSADAVYELRRALPGARPLVPLATVESDGAIVVTTGTAVFRCAPGGSFPFGALSVGGESVVDLERSGIIVENSRGRKLPVVIASVATERNGPVHAVIRCDGYVGARLRPPMVMTMRLHFFAGSAAVRVELTFRNPRKAKHPGGYWSLGHSSSIFLRHVAVRLALADASDSDGPVVVRSSPERGVPFEAWATPFELYQDSSGGPVWNSPVHVNRHGVVPATFRGYRAHGGGRQANGLRACPAVVLERGSTMAAFAVPQFWQNCPKAIEASDAALDLALFPAQYADAHELQGGEQKTHTFVMAFGPDAISDGTFDWARAPLAGRTTPEWYASTEAVPFLTPSAHDPHRDYLRLVDSVVEGDDAVIRKREVVDEYGWRNFGDLWADHEAVFAKGTLPLVSHYNNQYDGVAGFACQFMRSGDTRYWELMDDLARHVVDIDVYHTDEDRAAYNHGLFWHTCHYTDAGPSSHRAYPSARGVTGGGPGNEHDYSTGLMLHYFLTGDPQSRQTVVELAGWVLAMDDGGRNWLRWVDDGPTGLASATVSPDYHGPGRGAAYSINTLLDAHRLTGDAVYLEKAEALVRRSVRPDDDMDALDLLDAERRWSYTVFLQVLARYLDYLAERGDLGTMYAYGRETLLRYARWMAENERPYLDHPEKLEYPNETWAAQDLRKAAVFALAARHMAGAERKRLLERASGFFRYAISTLDAHVTRTLTRPQVLLMTNGYMQAYFAAHPESAAPAPTTACEPLPKRVPFVTQRARIKRRAVASAAVGASVIAGLLLALGAAVGWTVIR